MFGATNTEALQYWQYLGGLDRIRGFADNRFSGSQFLLSNTEFRHPVFKRDWLVLQTVAFLDMVSRAEKVKELGTLDGASTGGGVRLFFPNIYRLTLRLDYATPLVKNDDINFSFWCSAVFLGRLMRNILHLIFSR